ncbi:MAG TPA: hypothetical protein VN282_08920 [Pyrinomonadaceae bacterium]|nr:hypothetical protein [Pyrinomonadaceae bacterium]
MSTAAKKLDFLASIAIILVAVLMGVVLIKNYIFNSGPASHARTAAGNQIKTGGPISLPNVDWSGHGHTLLLAISTTCQFCSESAAFYRRLAQGQRSYRLIAISPQTVNETQKYLDRLGVAADGVMQVPLDSLGIRGTPTLALIDGEGVVADVWVGKLPAGEEAGVIGRLQNLTAKASR